MTDGIRVGMSWHCYEVRKTSPLSDTSSSLFIGGTCAFIVIALGFPVASVAFFGIIAIPLILLIKPRLRVDATPTVATFSNQPLRRNRLAWLALVLLLMGGALLIQLCLGVDQAWRLVFPAVCFLLVGVVVGVMAARTAGGVAVSASSICLNGRAFPFDRYRVDVWVPARGALGVQLQSRGPTNPSARPTYIPYGTYGIDANTFVSVVDLLIERAQSGTKTTGGEIAAMLMVMPPRGVAAGESIPVVVEVPAQDIAQ